MKEFTFTTERNIYRAKKNQESEESLWTVYCEFSEKSTATFNFRKCAVTAVIQKILELDKITIL